MYLLFDESNPLHKDDSNFVFTTEGHILTLDSKLLRPLSAVRRKLRRAEDLKCPAYNPVHILSTHETQNNISSGLVKDILFRPDVDYARALVAAAATDYEEYSWSEYGHCVVPVVDVYVCHFEYVPHDTYLTILI